MPDGWVVAPFGDLYRVPSKNGLMAPKRVRGEGVPLVNMKEIFAFDRIGAQDMELAPLPRSNSDAWLLAVGDLLFARQSLTREGAGKCSLVVADPRDRTFESHIIRVRLDPTKADPRFYFFLFRSRSGRDLMNSIVEQVAAAGIRASDLAKLPVSCPALEVQRRIADVLEAFDQLIDHERDLARLCPLLARTGLRKAAADGREWRLEDIAEVRRGLSYRGAGLSSEGIPMVNMGSAADFGWLKRSGWKYYVGDYKPRHLARARDLIVTNTEQTWRQEIIGWPLLVPSDIPLALFTHHMYLIDFKPGYEWLRLPLWAYLYEPDARAMLDGAVRGTTVANLPTDAFERLVFRAPDAHHPALVAARALLESAWSSELAETELVRARDELLPLLLSGRVRVEEAAA